MAKLPRETSGYIVLPLSFRALPSFPKSTTHCIYLRPHEPKLPDPDSVRSLFLVNIPITTTTNHLRHLFAFQLGSGRVERVDFQDIPRDKPGQHTSSKEGKNNKKRKRVTLEEIEVKLQSSELPSTWERNVHSSGAHAVVVFVDRPSMEASLTAAKRVAKNGAQIIWGNGIEEHLPKLGASRYDTHQRLRYPPRKEVLQSINSYMTTFSELEAARTRAQAQRRQLPDEEGFITVTKGSKGGVARVEEAKELAEKRKENNKPLENFYRFQMREKRKEKQGELIRKFEEDRRKVAEMRMRRGRIRVRAIMHRATMEPLTERSPNEQPESKLFLRLSYLYVHEAFIRVGTDQCCLPLPKRHFHNEDASHKSATVSELLLNSYPFYA